MGKWSKKKADVIKSTVYFLLQGESVVRIGYAESISKRLCTYAAHCGVPIRILATATMTRAEELAIHARFRGASYYGEFYNITPELISYIASVRGRGESYTVADWMGSRIKRHAPNILDDDGWMSSYLREQTGVALVV